MKNFEHVRILFKEIFKEHSLANKIYFVGGCVRDYLRGKDPHDIDLVIEENYGSMKFTKFLHEKLKHKTTEPFRLGHYPIWSITFTENFEFHGIFFPIKDFTIEVADTMKEEFHDKNSRQRHTKFASLAEDILRRDFSVNSGLMNLNGDLVYPNGINKDLIKDIQKGIIKCNDGVDKDKIFSDDPLRMIRAAVFATRFNWEIEKDTIDAIIRNADRIKIVAEERIIREISKVVNISQGMYKFIVKLDELNLLDKIFPDIYHQKEIKQQPDIRGIHIEGETVYHHTLCVLKNAKPGLVNSLAALFHDVGKNEKTREEVDGKVRFIGHEFLGKRMAWNILHQMKFPHDIIKDVCFLIEKHMLIHMLKDLSDKNIRKFLRNCETEEKRQMLFDLVNADCLGTVCRWKDGTISPIPLHYEAYDRINEVLEMDARNAQKPSRIFNGHEIMEALNIKGKDVGEAIQIMLDVQDEYGLDVDKEFAMKEIKGRFFFNRQG